ncbi:MAG: glycoside hydrolase family 32 protein [Planctomycetota bacterium]
MATMIKCFGDSGLQSAAQKDSIKKDDIHRELRINKRYLNMPVKNGASKRCVDICLDGKKVRQFEIELPAMSEKPDFWIFLDVAEFKNKILTVQLLDANNVDPNVLSSLTLDDQIKGSETMYHEKLRPQFHFTSRRGWNNDTNGLVYYNGEYHLFYQHNPYGSKWGNMTWGHAVSKDLVHWTELSDALHPDELGTIFSGSAVVDWKNTSGFQTGSEKALVCAYTSAGGTNVWSEGKPFTQSIAYSNDNGRTWSKYENNPVLGHIVGGNRDPKVIWNDQKNEWVMALFLDGTTYCLLTSPDLKKWKRICDINMPGCSECPDFFPLAVDGDSTKMKWVFWTASGKYVLGDFDGNAFMKTSEIIPCYAIGSNVYAGQTWSDIPASDGRRIHCAWMQQEMPGMPFNQMLTFPVELTLRTTQEGIRIFTEPVKEIKRLHDKAYVFDETSLVKDSKQIEEINSELMHIRGEFLINDGTCGFSLNGVNLVYNSKTQELGCLNLHAKLNPVNGKIQLEILIDRTSLEIFANDGLVYMPIGRLLVKNKKSISIIRTGDTKVNKVEIFELKSAWR